MDEPLIKLRPTSDFEKLLFAQKEIKDLKKIISKLKIEVGILESELHESKHELESYFKEIKGDDWRKRYELQKRYSSKQQRRIKELRKQNRELVNDFLQLKIKQSND